MSFVVSPDDTLEPAEFYGDNVPGTGIPQPSAAAGGDSMKFEVETVRVFPDSTIDIDTILATGKDAVTPTDSGKPSDVAAAAKRAGIEVVDADTITAWRREAAEGRTIQAAAEQQRIEVIVSDAIKVGKIGPARNSTG